MTGADRGKGKEKVDVPRRGRGRQQLLTEARTMPRARGRGIVIRDLEDTEMPSPAHSLPADFLGGSYVPDLSGFDTPEGLYADFPQGWHDDDMTLPPEDHMSHQHEQVPTSGSREMAGSSGVDSRGLIFPRGDEFGGNQSDCARQIGKIIESKFEGAWTCFTQVPIDTRNLWFREFELYFRWRDGHRREIRRIFNHIAAHSFKNKMYAVRKGNRRPGWIPEAVWAALLVSWSSERYKKLRVTNKKNRASDCSGEGFPLHFGGSITHLTHRDRLKEQLGREPTVAEGFFRTHARIEADGSQRWSDNRSHTRHDAYVERYEPSSSDGSTSAPIPPLELQMERWTEMVGGEKKGSVFGLAGLAAQRHRSYPPSDREEQLQGEISQLQGELGDMRTRLESQTAALQSQTAELDQMRTRYDSQQSQIDTLTRFMTQMQHAPSSTPFPPSTSHFAYPTTVPRPSVPFSSSRPGDTSSHSGHANIPPTNSPEGDNTSDQEA